VLVPRNPTASALRVFTAVSALSETPAQTGTESGRDTARAGEAQQERLHVDVVFEGTAPTPSDTHCGDLNAVLGVIQLGDARWPVPVLVVVTAMSVATHVLAAPCYKVTDVALLQLGGGALLSRGTALQRSKLESDMTSVRLFLNTGGLFVAPGIDLSRPMQEAQLHPGDPWQVRLCV
jgi:hypothetical protein